MLNVSIIPSHDIATWLLKHIDALLNALGLSKHQTAEQIIYFVVIFAASFFIGWGLRRIILTASQKVVRLHNTPLGRDILKGRVLTKCSHIIPPLVFLSLIPFAFSRHSEILSIILHCTLAYIMVCFGIGLNAVLTLIFSRYDAKENTKGLPIKGVLNIAKGFVWCVVVICAVSVIVQKSPAALLGGLTAFAAALMLVFKDSILGFVAGIQMSQNDMLRVGDWIVVPSTLANGIVIDVSLTTVKVQNFDNTIVMVPPYTLVSTSFQNWRGMSESGIRRVSQNIYFNPDTIAAPTAQQLADLSEKLPLLKPWIDNMQASGKSVAWERGNAPENGTIETNLGLFRAYIVQYLLHCDMVDTSTDLMASLQPMSPEGVPLQLYFFAKTTQWEQYEGVRSAVLEHAMLTASAFGLEILSADHLNVTSDNAGSKAAQ